MNDKTEEKQNSETHSKAAENALSDDASEMREDKPIDKEIHDHIGKCLEELGVDKAVVITEDPETGNVGLFYRGHFYDAARLVSQAYFKFRDQIRSEIGGT